jgi:nucleosome binding factor SPN SPT16 subunit
MPTLSCLVELIETPFTVISIADINVVNLERIGFGLRNYDMAIVFKVRRPCARPEHVLRHAQRHRGTRPAAAGSRTCGLCLRRAGLSS